MLEIDMAAPGIDGLVAQRRAARSQTDNAPGGRRELLATLYVTASGELFRVRESGLAGRLPQNS